MIHNHIWCLHCIYDAITFISYPMKHIYFKMCRVRVGYISDTDICVILTDMYHNETISDFFFFVDDRLFCSIVVYPFKKSIFTPCS